MNRAVLRVLRIALAIAVLAILHLATTQRSYPVVEDLNDKVSHVLAFAALALLADFSFPARRFGAGKVVALLAFGLLIEVVQYFLPYRQSSVFDWLADAVGIAAYALCIPLLRRLPVLRQRWDPVPGSNAP